MSWRRLAAVAITIPALCMSAGCAGSTNQAELKPEAAEIQAAIDPALTPQVRKALFKDPGRFSYLGGPGPYWPERAVRLGVSGATVIKCDTLTTGKLENCTVSAEAPAGYGFAAAAPIIAERGYMTVQASPGLADGAQSRLLIDLKLH